MSNISSTGSGPLDPNKRLSTADEQAAAESIKKATGSRGAGQENKVTWKKRSIQGEDSQVPPSSGPNLDPAKEQKREEFLQFLKNAQARLEAEKAMPTTVPLGPDHITALKLLLRSVNIQLTAEDYEALQKFFGAFGPGNTIEALKKALQEPGIAFDEHGGFTQEVIDLLEAQTEEAGNIWDAVRQGDSSGLSPRTFSTLALLLLLMELSDKQSSLMSQMAREQQKLISATYDEEGRKVQLKAWVELGAALGSLTSTGLLGAFAGTSEAVQTLSGSVAKVLNATGGVVSAGVQSGIIEIQKERQSLQFNQRSVQELQRSFDQQIEKLLQSYERMVQEQTGTGKAIGRNIV